MKKLVLVSGLVVIGIALLLIAFWSGILAGAKIAKENYLSLSGFNNSEKFYRFDGFYFPITQDILINAKGQDLSEVKDTAYHEIGHYVYAQLLSRAHKIEYNEIYVKSNIKFNNSLYGTHYDESDFVGEDFVRSFACWSLKTCVLDKERKLFFEKEIGE